MFHRGWGINFRFGSMLFLGLAMIILNQCPKKLIPSRVDKTTHNDNDNNNDFIHNTTYIDT